LIDLLSGGQCLQCEQLLPGARADCDPLSDAVANEVIQRARLPGAGEPGVLDVALDEATPLQHSPDAFGNLLHQELQLRAGGRWHVPEHWGATLHGQVHASLEGDTGG
jgi:hypothetical protein